MIFPTLIISIIIAWRTRHMMAELTHNLAITLWILANSYWMTTEFIGIDSSIVYGSVTFKHMAIVPFLMGVGCLAYYYLFWAPKHPQDVEIYDVGNEVAITNLPLVGKEEKVELK